jgi:iron complex outermembrane receptor protein
LQPDGRTIGRTRRYHDFHWNNLTARAELTAKFTLLGVANDVRIGADRVRHGQSQLMLQARGTAAAPILTIDALDPAYGKTTSAMPTNQNFRDAFASESIYAQDLLTAAILPCCWAGAGTAFARR